MWSNTGNRQIIRLHWLVAQSFDLESYKWFQKTEMTDNYTLKDPNPWLSNCIKFKYLLPYINYRQEKNLPSFPQVTPDFCMQRPHFLRSCFQCESPLQRMSMCFDGLPDAILAHFVEGLCGSEICDYDFCHQGVLWYAVRGVVQYTNRPDHFVVWLRNVHSKYGHSLTVKDLDINTL